LLLTDYSAAAILDLLKTYNGPYIFYTSEVVGCAAFERPREQGLSCHARHIELFKNNTH
jgi:hypothetical protein